MKFFGKSWLSRARIDEIQTHEFTNEAGYPIEVMVELIPNRYILQHGDNMKLEFSTVRGVGMSTNFYDRHMQIYCGVDVEPKVWINGKTAEPDWDTQLPAPQ